MNRCVQTLAGIKGRSQLGDNFNDVTHDPRLREKSGGEWEGEPLIKFKVESEKANMPIRDFSAPGGERWKDVYLRAQDFFNKEII